MTSCCIINCHDSAIILALSKVNGFVLLRRWLTGAKAPTHSSHSFKVWAFCFYCCNSESSSFCFLEGECAERSALMGDRPFYDYPNRSAVMGDRPKRAIASGCYIICYLRALTWRIRWYFPRWCFCWGSKCSIRSNFLNWNFC